MRRLDLTKKKDKDNDKNARAHTETETSTLKIALDPDLILLTFLKVGTRLAGPVLTRLLVSDRDGMIL